MTAVTAPPETAPLSLRIRRHGGAALVVVAGELDVSNLAQLRAAIDAAVERGASCIGLDLRHLDFLDATGLGVLIGARHRAAELGIALVVRRPGRAVRRVFDATGLGEYLLAR